MIGGSLTGVPDVIVIGAGVVGASTAHALAEAGASVVVLDAGGVGSGTSAATFAVDITRVKTPRALFDLGLASAGEHAALQAVCGGRGWLHRAGTLEWESTEPDRQRLRDRVERVPGWGCPARWLARSEIPVLEPALAAGLDEKAEIAFYPGGGWYEPDVFVRALLNRAQRLGTALHSHDSVTGMRIVSGRITQLRTTSGARFSADTVVNCAGPQANDVAALGGAVMPLRRVPGLVVTTTPVANGLRTILATPDLNLRPHVAGRVMLHSWLLDRQLPGTDAGQRHALAGDLMERARKLLPGMARAGVHCVRVGIRPVPPDGLPIVGHLDGVANLYTVVSHSAVHLAPILGRLAAHELIGSPQERLQPFRPARFTPGAIPTGPTDENTRTMFARIGTEDGMEAADVGT